MPRWIDYLALIGISVLGLGAAGCALVFVQLAERGSMAEARPWVWGEVGLSLVCGGILVWYFKKTVRQMR